MLRCRHSIPIGLDRRAARAPAPAAIEWRRDRSPLEALVLDELAGRLFDEKYRLDRFHECEASGEV